MLLFFKTFFCFTFLAVSKSTFSTHFSLSGVRCMSDAITSRKLEGGGGERGEVNYFGTADAF